MNGCNNYKKSTFVATGLSAVVPTNGTLTFGTTQRITGNAISMGLNNTSINLNRPGLYLVSVSATATGAENAEAVNIQLNRNGVALTDGFATFTPATAAGNAENMSFTTVVEVNTTNGAGYKAIPLTITNTGQSATYTFSEITIVKFA